MTRTHAASRSVVAPAGARALIMSYRSLLLPALVAACWSSSTALGQPADADGPAEVQTPSPPDDADTAPDASDATDAAPSAAASDEGDGRPPRVHQHGFGAGYRGLTLEASDGTRYFLSGPTGAYSYFVGRRWGFFIGGEGSYLVRGRMSSLANDFNDGLRSRYDERTYAFDLQLLAARRIELDEKLALTVGGGVHVQAFVLRGSQYLPVEAITGGFGAVAKLDYLVNSWFSLQASANVAIDALDFVRHVNPALLAVPMSLSVGVGVRR